MRLTEIDTFHVPFCCLVGSRKNTMMDCVDTASLELLVACNPFIDVGKLNY